MLPNEAAWNHTLNKIRELWCFPIKVYRIPSWITGICHDEKHYPFFNYYFHILVYMYKRKFIKMCTTPKNQYSEIFKGESTMKTHISSRDEAATKQAHSNDTSLQSVHILSCHIGTLFPLWIHICFKMPHILTGLEISSKHYILTGLGICSKHYHVIEIVAQCLVIYLHYLLCIPVKG
jgi:hypothetical protein